MSVYEGIKNKIYTTIHRNRKPIEQIADEMGISTESLYRYGLPGPSGSDIPLKRLMPLMKATNDYSILKHLATLCGFIIVKIPRYKASRGDSLEIVSNYQASTSQAVIELTKFFQNPTQKQYELLHNALDKVMEQSVGVGKYVDKEYAGQIEIFGE